MLSVCVRGCVSFLNEWFIKLIQTSTNDPMEKIERIYLIAEKKKTKKLFLRKLSAHKNKKKKSPINKLIVNLYVRFIKYEEFHWFIFFFIYFYLMHHHKNKRN